MITSRLTFRTVLPAVLAVGTAIGLAGCRAIDFYEQPLQEPVPQEMKPGRELNMVSLPAYRIEPPDVLQIEMLKQVPLPPYRVEIYDVLQLQVVGTLLDQPIGPTDRNGGFYLVEAEGMVNLGPAYGTVRVAGMTIEEATEAIRLKLLEVLRDPQVSVQLARSTGTQPVTGEYLVGPDGTINLRQYGAVHMAGKTLAEAAIALEKHLGQYFDSPEVSVNVVAYNSKIYYIITEGANLGDNIVRVPITGNETVLDAITGVGGLSQLSSTKVWIARPAPDGFGCEQILPVNYEAVTRGASTATNYQLMPDDRLFIAEDKAVALANFVNKVIAPIERVVGMTSLTGSTVRNLQTLGRAYNYRRGY